MYKKLLVPAALIIAWSCGASIAQAQFSLENTIYGPSGGQAQAQPQKDQGLGGGNLFDTPWSAPSTAISPKGNEAQGASSLKLGGNAAAPGKLAVGTPRPNSDVPTYAFGAPILPFGVNLFRGQFVAEREDGLNPDYMVGTGDRIAIRIWGAKTFNGVLNVDIQGNIFLPDIGPVKVSGVKNRNLQQAIVRKVNSVFKSSVQVYINLLSSQPIGVFVSGYVPKPGRYAGVPTDSLLYFLDRAGGIDPKRGSFRNVMIHRGGKPLVNVDLYSFLLNGVMPKIQFEDGDTLIVPPRLGTVRVEGAVRNAAVYELISEAKVTGQSLTTLAAPNPEVSHVALSGIRNGKPANIYLPLTEFMKAELGAGDVVRYIPDQKAEKIFVNINGEYKGPGIFSISQGTHLKDVLNLVEINPQTANADAIYLKRRSVAFDQKNAIDQSLNQLEKSVLTAYAASDGVAAIRKVEADLMMNFIQRARKIVPEGKVVIANQGQPANVMLEQDDIIVVPRRTDIIQVNGEVVMPQAVVFSSNMTLDDYVAQSGGYSHRASKSNILVIRQSGEVFQAGDRALQAGDQILLLPEIDQKKFQLGKELMQVIYQIAVASAVILTL